MFTLEKQLPKKKFKGNQSQETHERISYIKDYVSLLSQKKKRKKRLRSSLFDDIALSNWAKVKDV